MFLIEEALQQILRTSVEVSALVDDRIYPGILPQNVELPAVAFSLKLRNEEQRLEERGSSGIAHSTYEFMIQGSASGYLANKYIDETVRLFLQGYRGTVVRDSGTPETIEILHIQSIDSREAFNDQTRTHYVFHRYVVHHEIALPI